MKLAKLSLAAIVAAGAMTTFASAQPLEEAIKGVQVSGFVRYRYYNDSEGQYVNKTTTTQSLKNGAATITETDNGNERHRFSAPITFIAPVADNITTGVTVSVERSDFAANSANGTDDVTMTKFWFKYATNDYSVRLGKQEIATPWTESGYGGSKGNGIVAMYTAIPGWTLAAAGFASTSGVDLGDDGENLYAAAAIGSFGPVNAQVWIAKQTNVIDSSIFAQLDGKFEGFSLKAQMNSMKLADEALTNPTDEDSGLYYGVEAGFGMDAFALKAGYLANDEDMGISRLDADADGFIAFGQQLYAAAYDVADVDTMYAVASFKTGAVGLEAGYGVAEEDASGYEIDEFYGKVSYAVNKKFGLSAYYSVLGADDAEDENDEFRFEAKYTF